MHLLTNFFWPLSPQCQLHYRSASVSLIIFGLLMHLLIFFGLWAFVVAMSIANFRRDRGANAYKSTDRKPRCPHLDVRAGSFGMTKMTIGKTDIILVLNDLEWNGIIAIFL